MRVPLKWAAIINEEELPEDTDPEFSFRYVDIAAVDSTGAVHLPAEEIQFSLAPSRARRLASQGDTIISTVRTYLRAIARVPDGGLVFSTGFATVKPLPSVDPNFLYYACRSDHFVEQIVSRSSGVSYPAINPSDLGMLEISLPPLGEQRRIADFLDDQVTRLDSTIDSRRRQLGALQAATVAAAHESVLAMDQGPRKPSTIAWATDIPEHWGEVSLRLVARMGTGHTPSRSQLDYWVDCDVPWLTTGDVKRFRADEIDSISETAVEISQLGLRNSAAVVHPANTVALSRTASAGFSIVMDRDMATSQDFATWTPGPLLRSHYLLWCLRVMRRDLLQRLAMGSTHKTIYFPDLEGIRIPLPPLKDQDRAVVRIQGSVAKVRTTIGAVERSIALLAERKRALITAAVTGEFDVTTASRVLARA